jgi:hypothetical protein
MRGQHVAERHEHILDGLKRVRGLRRAQSGANRACSSARDGGGCRRADTALGRTAVCRAYRVITPHATRSPASPAGSVL